MMNRKVFSQVVGVGLAIMTAGIAPFAASAQTEASRHPLANAAVGELTQVSNAGDMMTLPAGTLVFSQTAQIAVRVYNSDGAPRLNLYNKQTGVTELRGVTVTVEPAETGITYRYARERRVEIMVVNSGEQTITLNGMAQQASSTITGTVTYLPRIALPPNAVVEVSLVDVSRADAPAITLASQQIVSGGRQVPFPFTLPYDSGQIDARSSYAVQSRITVDGELQFVTTTQFPVITNGNPTAVEVRVDLADQMAGDETQLTNTVWQLEQIQYNDDKLLESASLGAYTIEFMENGQLSIRADCNQALGSFTEEGGSLSIALGPTTLAACPSESIGQEYLQALQNADTYFFQEGDLFIDIRLDTGTMRFTRAGDLSL